MVVVMVAAMCRRHQCRHGHELVHRKLLSRGSEERHRDGGSGRI